MEAHAAPGYQPRAQRERLAGATLARFGAIAGLAGGMMMAMWQMVVGAIAQDPTAIPGIHQSFWTAVTSITSVIFGTDAFHGSFHLWPVIGGLMGHMMNSMILGIVGVAILTAALGPRVALLPAMILGMMFGLALEAIILNLIVNQIQDVNTVYTSTPEWSWWVAHALYGATLGAIAAALLRRAPA